MTVKELVDFAYEINGLGGSALPPSMLYTIDELTVLANTIDALPQNASCLEVGVYVGRSCSMMLNCQKEKNLDIWLVDSWAWNVPDAKISFDHHIATKFPYAEFHPMWMSSEAADSIIPQDQLFDYIHIDADHNEKPVRFDIKAWVIKRLKPGAVACFHDVDFIGVSGPIDDLLGSWETVDRRERTIAKRKPL